MAIIKNGKIYYSKDEAIENSNKRIRQQAENFAKKVIKEQKKYIDINF